MPRRIGELTETGIIAEMRAELRRLWRAVGSNQGPVGEYNEYTLASSSDSAHTLTYIPSLSLIPIALLNGLAGRYGTDYTVDFPTGIVTWSATKVAGDILEVFYQTTGDLIALSGPVITGTPPTFKNATTAGLASIGTNLSVASPTCAVGDLLILAFHAQNFAVSGTPTGGWTLLTSVNANDTGGDLQNFYVYTRTATSTDAGGTTYTATATGSDYHTIIAFSYGPGSAGVFNTNATTSSTPATNTSWSCPTVTATDAATIVEIWSCNSTGTQGDLGGPGSPTTTRAAVTAGAAPHAFSHLLAIDEPQSAAGTTTARVATSATGGSWASITVSLST